MLRVKIKNLKEVPGYIDTLAVWHHKQWGYLYPDKTLETRKKQMQKYLTDSVIPTTCVAESDSKPVGSAALVESDMDIKPELKPWLASVYVDPKARNSGVGTLLVLHIMKLAQDNGIKNFYLYTPDKESFYKKLGWKTIEKVNYRGEDVVVMEFSC